jgi:hypothetical protein
MGLPADECVLCRLLQEAKATVRDGPAFDICLTRAAIATLVQLVIACPSNVSKLLGLTAQCNSLFVVGLQICSDFGVQVMIILLTYQV